MNAKARSPLFLVTTVLAIVGAALPLASLVRGGGLRGSMNDAGLLVALWDVSPFALLPVAAWIARRPWVRKMLLVLTAVSVLAGLIIYQVQLPRLSGADATLLYIFGPIWQWPIALLSAALALLVPSADDEQRMEGEPAEPPAAGA
jgi:hypothetical protein